MRYLIEHETRLDFPVPVQEHHCEIRVTPRESAEQQLISHRIDIDPPADQFSYTDSYGNKVVHFSVIAPHQQLITRARSEVKTLRVNPFDYIPMSPDEEMAWYRQELQRHPELWQFILHSSLAVPTFASLDLGDLQPPKRDTSQSIQISLLAAIEWVYQTLRYQTGATRIDTPLVESLKARQGVCQDFAHLTLSLVRSWNIPARYVMGYMRGSTGVYEDSQGEEATHAWTEMLIPGAGWRGFDATNKLCANDFYIPVAVGRDYQDAAPQRGTFKGSTSQETPKVRVILQEQSAQDPPLTQQQMQVVQ